MNHRMRSMALGLLFVYAGCAVARTVPPPPATRPEPPQTTASRARVLVRPDTEGLHVSYLSLPPAQTFRFGEAGTEIRHETWKVLGAGMSLVKDGVAATTPVSSFEVRIAPDERERDRVYPALNRVGEGWAIYAPHLRIEGGPVPGRLSIEVPPAWSVIGRRDAKGELVGDGYVFAGPSSYVHRGAADVVSAPSVPAWLLREIEQAARSTVAFYERRLGAPLRNHATIVVAHDPDKQGSFRGDTTPGAMMSLRFYGRTWIERDPAATNTLAEFVDHELFHFWNGELAGSSQGTTRPWLHEGAANYAALLAGRERGTMSNERFVAALNRHLERCQAALGNRDLRAHGPKQGGDTYACGTVLQWALDLGLRKSSGGQRDVLSWWKDVLAKAESDGGTYSLESAYGLVGPEASGVADVLLDGGDDRRWAVFAEAARRYGAAMVQSRQASRDMASALDHILSIHCGRDRGFFTFPDHVKLDTGNRCGPLNGDLEVDSVAGFNPVVASSAMHDKVRQLCAAKKPIDLGWRGKVVAQAPCTTSLAEPRLGWQIRQDSEVASGRP